MIFVELPVGLFFLAVGVYVMVVSWGMEFFSGLGPGPGFFPFCVGALLTLLTALWLARTALAPRIAMPADMVPDRGALMRIAGVLAALIGYALLLDDLGFRVAMLLFLFAVLAGPGRQSLLLSAVIAAIGSFGGYVLFHDLLDLHLPYASIGVLARLGL